ncbi:hypothetical protein PR048_009766 [Dryococelus australis]|uniref:Uncharacterized protein n=1 Tax=Dryococelus australis TaxID=614101 RepID=A0ABQ9I2N2_9NEOP|nr:hypothetical protein PR048_009766 [Dryococelus australis]
MSPATLQPWPSGVGRLVYGTFERILCASNAKFLCNNAGRIVTQFQASKLLGGAFLLAALPTTAINGFWKCAIFSLDPHVFSDADFVAAEPTGISVASGW